MIRRISRSLILLALAGWLSSVSIVMADAKNSTDRVRVEAVGGKIQADGVQEVTFTIEIEDGWHIYANPVGNEDLAGAQTTIKISGKQKPKEIKLEYPKGKLVKDATAGDYYTYEGKVIIKAKVTRAKDDKNPLDVSIKLQSCNEKICLPPGTLKLKVE